MGTADQPDTPDVSPQTFSDAEELVLRTVTNNLPPADIQRLFTDIVSIFRDNHSKVLSIVEGDQETSISLATIPRQEAVYIQEETRRAVSSTLKRLAYWATDRLGMTHKSHKKVLAIHEKSFGITESDKESIKGTFSRNSQVIQDVLSEIKATLHRIQSLEKTHRHTPKAGKPPTTAHKNH